MMRTELLQLRLQPDEKQAFQEAASLAGISLSSWVSRAPSYRSDSGT